MPRFYPLKKISFRYIFPVSLLTILMLPAVSAAQTNRYLTYFEIGRALMTKVPNKVYQNREQVMAYLLQEIARRKVDSPLTEDLEQFLRDCSADDRVIQTIRNSIAKNLDHIDAAFYCNRAEFFNARGFTDQALNDYQRALDLDPNFSLAYYNRGNYYLRKDENDKAIDDFSKYIEITGRSTYVNNFANKYFVFEGYYDRGRAYLNKRDYERALRDFNKFIQLSTNYDTDIINKSYSAVPEAYFNSAYCYSALGQYDPAISGYTKYISVKPDNSNAYNNRGVVYESKKDYQAAMRDFRKALQLDPNNATARRNLERVSGLTK